MLYELRIYTMYPGKMPDILKRFSEHTIGLFEKYDMKTIDFWQDAGKENKIYYILEHKDLETRNRNFNAFADSAEWKKVKSESEKNGAIVEKVENFYMTRVPFSPACKSE